MQGCSADSLYTHFIVDGIDSERLTDSVNDRNDDVSYVVNRGLIDLHFADNNDSLV